MHLRWSWGVFNAQIFEQVSKCTWFMHFNCALKSTFQSFLLIWALLAHTLPPREGPPTFQLESSFKSSSSASWPSFDLSHLYCLL